MGVTEVVTAPRSPWQNTYVERVIGSLRRECLDSIVIFNERHLRPSLASYIRYYHRSRTHLSLDNDCPNPRPIQPRTNRKVTAVPLVGGLHHRYERLTA
jgi:putative transposase